MIYILASIIAGYTLASMLGPSISHQAAKTNTNKAPPPPPPLIPGPRKIPIIIPYVPDTSCGGAPAIGKPALNFSINGVKFIAELDSGASNLIMKPDTAVAVGLTRFPSVPPIRSAFTGMDPETLQGFSVPVTTIGLPAMQADIYTGSSIGCNLIPFTFFEKNYTVTLSSTSATFTPI